MISKLSGINPDACSKRFVTASMNLADTANARLSQMLQNKSTTAVDNSTMSERIASYVASKSPFQMPAPAAKIEEIIPENSINYLG